MRFATRPGPAAALAAVVCLGVAAAAQSPPPALEIEAELVRNFSADQRAVWNYSHREAVVVAKNGRVSRREVLVCYVHGHQIVVTLAADGHALSAAQLAAQRQAASERAAALEHRPPPPPGSLVFNRKAYPFAKLADDFVYGPARTAEWEGRAIWIYPASPNPHAPSRSREEDVLLASRGEIWVDAADRHVMRIQLHTFEPVRYFLGILAVVHSAHLDLLLTRHAPGEWLPVRTEFAFDATVLFFKRLRESKAQAFSAYRRRVP